MGCFSFLCKKSGHAATSTSFDGDPVTLYLLKDGKVIEMMHGNYNSYGCVFDGKGESFQWSIGWGAVCDLMFSGNDGDGIALVLDKYDDGIVPTTQSEDDPNQGWGEGLDLIGDCSEGVYRQVSTPQHIVFNRS